MFKVPFVKKNEIQIPLISKTYPRISPMDTRTNAFSIFFKNGITHIYPNISRTTPSCHKKILYWPRPLLFISHSYPIFSPHVIVVFQPLSLHSLYIAICPICFPINAKCPFPAVPYTFLSNFNNFQNEIVPSLSS